eukprot:2108537-Pleurochrysis_carterae.AAC.1
MRVCSHATVGALARALVCVRVHACVRARARARACARARAAESRSRRCARARQAVLATESCAWSEGERAEALRRCVQYVGGLAKPDESTLLAWPVVSVNEWGMHQARAALRVRACLLSLRLVAFDCVRVRACKLRLFPHLPQARLRASASLLSLVPPFPFPR